MTKGPIAAVSTTTRDRLEVDDETRHISVWLDETPQQTKRIMQAALRAERPLDKKEVGIWYEVQRLLESRARLPIEFPNWFSDLVELVNLDSLWARRYFQAFLQACRTVALIRSFRRNEARLKPEKKITARFIDLAATILIFNQAFTESIDKSDDEDLQTQRIVRTISDEKGGLAVSATDLASKMNISSDRAYALLRKAFTAGAIRHANRPTKGNLKTYLPAEARSFLPEPKAALRALEGAPKKVRFIHPLLGKWLSYRR